MNKASFKAFNKGANNFMREIKVIVVGSKTGIDHFVLCEINDLKETEIALRAIKDHFPLNDKKMQIQFSASCRNHL